MAIDFDIPAGIKYHRKEEWLEFHKLKHVITGSQLPTMMGISKWESPHDLYRYKQGDSPPKEVTVAMRRGHAMEPLIHELYEEERGVTLKDAGDYTVFEKRISDMQLPDRNYVWAACTPDRFSSDGRIVEMKAPLMQPSPEDLECYKMQLKLTMKVTGWDKRAGHLAVLAGNDRLRVVPVEPFTEKEWIEVVTKAEDFCTRVINNNPDPTWLRYPKEKLPVPFGDGVEVTDESVAVDAAEYRFLGGLIDGLTLRQAEVRERIYEKMLKVQSSKLRSRNYKVRLYRNAGGKKTMHMPFDRQALDLLTAAGFLPRVSTSAPYTKLFIKRVEETDDEEELDERSDD